MVLGPNSEATEKTSSLPDDPTQPIGFEINPPEAAWTFIPTYYPNRFTQTKSKKLKRYGQQCSGEDVSIKTIKNRELHVSGILLANKELVIFRDMMDFNGVVEVISPLLSGGGAECFIKDSELGEKHGWDPMEEEWQFKYTLDLVSTGRDEYDDASDNAIVSAIRDFSVDDSGPGGTIL